MQDSESPLKQEDEEPSQPGPADFLSLRQLEVKYWALRKTRKTVRYTACFALSAQLAAASCCFIASPWAETTEKRQRLRLTGCLLLTTLSAVCLLISISSLLIAWVALLYSSFACAIASAVLKCIGLHTAPLALGSSIAVCCIVLVQLLVQPIPQGGWWALAAGLMLMFLSGTQHLLSSLAKGRLPGGVVAFMGRSNVVWLSPLIAATVLAAVLLMWHYLELVVAASRGGYYLFCPPNPGLHSLDALTADAVEGKLLCLATRRRPDSPSATVLSQHFAAELSPRRLGAALAQHRRTVAGPAAARNSAEPRTPTSGAVTPRGKDGRSKGAWLVALWLRGYSLVASLGCICVALSLLLVALAADSAAHGAQDPTVFAGLTSMLLPEQQHAAASFLFDGKGREPQGTPLALRHEVEDDAFLILQETRQRNRLGRHRLPLHPPDVMKRVAPLGDSLGAERDAGSAAADREDHSHSRQAYDAREAFLRLLSQDPPEGNAKAQQQRQKTAAALLLLAMALLLPLVGSILGRWTEDLFFAHMVLIKRNASMLIPPPVLPLDARKPPTEPATPPKDIVGPLLHMTKERVTHQSSQGFLGLAGEPECSP